MAKDIQVALLYEIYGGLLTSHQAEMLKLYYLLDLSLAEIAEEFNISRQGVKGIIDQGKAQIENFEAKLKIFERREDIKKIIESDIDAYEKIEKIRNII